MNLYEQWLQAKDELNQAKIAEMNLRVEICKSHLQDKTEGAKTDTMGKFKVTATAKLTRSIDPEVLEAIWEDLSDVEKECIVYKPNLKLANYKRIEQIDNKLMDAITVKPAAPALKIEVLEDE